MLQDMSDFRSRMKAFDFSKLKPLPTAASPSIWRIYEAEMVVKELFNQEQKCNVPKPELWMKFVCRSKRQMKLIRFCLHCFLSTTLQSGTIKADFAKICEAFTGEEFADWEDLNKLYVIANMICEEVKTKELYCKVRFGERDVPLGQKLQSLNMVPEVLEKSRIPNAVCDADKSLDWQLPTKEQGSSCFQVLREQNNQRVIGGVK